MRGRQLRGNLNGCDNVARPAKPLEQGKNSKSNFMVQCSNLNSVMESIDHLKNGLSSKNTTSRGNFLRKTCFALLITSIIFTGCSKKNKKIDVGVLSSSIYVDEKIKESNNVLKNLNLELYARLINNASIKDSDMNDLKAIHALTDSIYHQIKELKSMVVDISGGLKVEDNYYTINNLDYNFGHSNRLTGNKGMSNGEGSKLKHRIERLRFREIELLKSDLLLMQSVEKLLDTSERKESNSDYVFSWEEQYFKLLPTVGILNLLSIIENKVLNSEQIILLTLLMKG